MVTSTFFSLKPILFSNDKKRLLHYLVHSPCTWLLLYRAHHNFLLHLSPPHFFHSATPHRKTTLIAILGNAHVIVLMNKTYLSCDRQATLINNVRVRGKPVRESTSSGSKSECSICGDGCLLGRGDIATLCKQVWARPRHSCAEMWILVRSWGSPRNCAGTHALPRHGKPYTSLLVRLLY